VPGWKSFCRKHLCCPPKSHGTSLLYGLWTVAYVTALDSHFDVTFLDDSPKGFLLRQSLGEAAELRSLEGLAAGMDEGALRCKVR
jgi:hypothetical protein